MIDNLVSINCPTCGTLFALSKTVYDLRQKDEESFFCPAGHKIHFGGPTKTESLKIRIELLEIEIANLNETIFYLRNQVTLQMRRAAGYKGQWVRARAANRGLSFGKNMANRIHWCLITSLHLCKSSDILVCSGIITHG